MRSLPEPDPGAPGSLTPARYLRWLITRHPTTIIVGALLGSAWVIAQALVPATIGQAIDNGIAARDERQLLLWAGATLALGIIQAAAGIMQDRFALTAGLAASYRTLQLVARHASALGATLPARVSTGEALSVGVADVTQIGKALEFAPRGVGAVAAIVVVAAIMLTTSWQLGLVVLVGVPAMAWALSLALRPLHARQHELRRQQAELTARGVDIVSGVRVLRGIGGEQMFAQRYRSESQRVRRAGVRVAAIEALLDGARVLLPGLLVAVVVWAGARAVLAGEITAGQLVAFYGYAVFLTIPLRRLTFAASHGMKAYVAARRVTALLSLSPEITDSERVPPVVETATPRTAPLLADPGSGLVVQQGRFTAVACAISADAAVLADRLGRYVDSDVTFEGKPLRAVPRDEVRRRILVVENGDRLFSGLLRTELDPAGHDGDVRRSLDDALGAASARDIVAGLPAGLDTEITGREFSGGQEQRLRLARALMVDPEVLVLVDPTSAVDAHTESRIAAGLARIRAGRTTVVFTTSPILLARAAHVAYVEREKVIATGTHDTLLADPAYRSAVARDAEDDR